MLPRIGRAPALAGAAVVTLCAGDLVWLATRHLVPYRCGTVYAHSSWAPALAISGGVIAVACLLTVLVDWVAESTGSGRGGGGGGSGGGGGGGGRGGRGGGGRAGRRMSVAVAATVLLGTVVSLGAMYADATIQLCG